MHEDLPDILKSHALDFRITKVHCDPSEEAYRSIKPERSARGRVLHLGQERTGDDDVGAPAGASKHHGSQSADFHGEEFG